MATCSRDPRSNSSMNGSPAISAEKRVQRAQRTQRSRSSSTVSPILIGLRWPTTSTRHWRQAPSGSSSRWSQKRGIWMSICSAARITSVPGATSSSWSSMVTFTVVRLLAIGGVSRVRANRHALPAERAAVAFDVLVELFAEVLKGRDDRADGAVAERAEGAAEDRVADVLQRVHVLLAAGAGLQPGEDLGHPVGALAARRALAAGL